MVSPRRSSSRIWFAIAAIAAIVAGIVGVRWWLYDRDIQLAAKAYRFNSVEIALTQPPFNDITTQIDGSKWLPNGPQDIVKDPESIALYETITLALRPLTTGTGCSGSTIVAYQVLVDAPGFTVDRIGDAARTRQTLLAPECSLGAKAPPPAPPWRWNLMATEPGNHVITMVLQALDRQQHVVDSREVDIPVFVPTPPEPISSNIGLIGIVVSITTGLVGLWERFRKTPSSEQAAPLE